MKNLFTNAFLFIIFAVVFSTLTGCSKSATSTNQEATNTATAQVNTESNDSGETKKENTEYPKIPVALAAAEIKKVDDSSFKLEDKKGNVVLLNLWATWCGPCRGEMPHLIEMEDKFKSKNFEIVGLNTDNESVEDINKFAEQMKLNYQMAYADTAMMKEFLSISKFQGIPQSFLIDRDGRLRGVFMGGGPKVINTMKETVEKVVNE